MTTLAEFMIVAGADNRPPMLDKPQYESWKSRMELYIQGKDHGRIILNAVENGPLIWPTVELEDDTVRLKTYEELSDKEKLQADCDLKATNIVLQGTSLSKTRSSRAGKLYDEFDKFSHVKGETLHQYYLRFAQLIIDMNIIQMTMQPVQVNTKFLNALPLEWGKIVTDVKLARDLHTSNYDQLYAYLKQQETHANEARLMRERFPDPLALVANYHQPQSHFNNYHSQYTTPHHTQPSVPQNAYLPLTIPQQPQAEFPQLDSGLAVPTFLPGDDPIACMNKAMAFLSAVFSPRYTSTNNQLRSSSNPRNQATVQDGRCTQPKKRRDATWFKDKVFLIQAHAEGKELDEERLAFLADPGVADGQVAQTITHNAAFQTDDLDALPYSDTFQNEMMNQSVQELQYYEQSPIVDYPDNEITSDSNIIPYS
ncbi:hypothetical protein Tco_1284159 [Tanacetum coccineum]